MKMGKTTKLTAPVQPRGNSEGRFYEAAGVVCEQAGAGASCTGHADRRNCERAAADYGGYCAPVGALLQNDAEFWLNLQNFYDLECERRAGKMREIERQVQPVG